MERRWKVGSGNVEDSFVDPAYGGCCASCVAYVIDEGEGEARISREGTQPPAHFARTPLTGGKICVGYRDTLATAGQSGDYVAVG